MKIGEQMMSLRQLAQRAGVTVHALRNYLRRGRLRVAMLSAVGYQFFGDAEVRRLRFIRTTQRLGFTLAEIEEIIRRSRRQSPCPLLRDIICRRLDDTRQQLNASLRMLRQLQIAVKQWDQLPDPVPTGKDICGLIEAIAAKEGLKIVKTTRDVHWGIASTRRICHESS